MKPERQTAALILLILYGITSTAGSGGDKAPVPTLRWAETQPGCTFSHDDDGKDRYGLWKADLGVTLAVDGHELQDTRRRPQHLLAIYLTIHYRGNGSQEVPADHITLEFLSHSKVIHPALGPDNLSTSLQDDADTLSDEFEHEVRKHPDQKEEKEARLQAYQKDTTETQEFVTGHSLRPGTLDPGNRELSGWLFFSTKDKWIGAWKKQEQFLLRIPLAGQVFEVPFKLRSADNEPLLRTRP